MKKEKLTVLFCQIGTAITYLSLKWFPLPLPLSVAFTKFIIFTYKDSYINQSATFHSDRTNLNIKREKCDFSFFNISIGHKLSLSLQNLIINPFNYMAFTNNIIFAGITLCKDSISSFALFTYCTLSTNHALPKV